MASSSTPIFHEEGWQCQTQGQQYREYSATHLQHICSIDIDRKPAFVRQTNIICTIGEACDSPEMLREMITNGMNVARLNLTLGSYAYNTRIINLIRKIGKSVPFNRTVAIAVDVTAPTVRTGLVNGDVNAEIRLVEGHFVTLTTDITYKEACSVETVWIDNSFFKNVLAAMSVGDRVHIDDGALSVIVRERDSTSVRCLVEQGGLLGGSKRVQLPRSALYKYSVLEKYRQSLLFAIENEVDMVFASFIESGEDVKKIRSVMGSAGNSIALIAKIETKNAAKTFEGIIAEADGIIISRGDLGLELPIEKVFILQKNIIARCLRLKKPVIVSTQMLESMRHKPRPTRAEVSDVANAANDGADGIILGPETARGHYPISALKTAHEILREAESGLYHRSLFLELKREVTPAEEADANCAVAVSAVEASLKSRASAIIVITTTGKLAYQVASYRPPCPILTVTRRRVVAKMCNLYRGLHPIYCEEDKQDDWSEDMDMRINVAIDRARERNFLTGGDRVIIITGWHIGTEAPNVVRIIEVPEKKEVLKVITSGQCITDYDD